MNKRLDSKDVDWRERNKRERHRKGGRDRHEAFKKDELQQEIRAVEDHTSLNVTQAADHEARWREQKKKKTLRDVFVYKAGAFTYFFCTQKV